MIYHLVASLLPTGGGEPVYNFNYWEENKLYANCYIYAMDVITSTVGGVNPGHYGGGEITFEDLSKSNICSLMYTGTKNDGPYLGNGRSIRSSSKNEKPRSNEYKVAIVIAPGVDYHWYVKNLMAIGHTNLVQPVAQKSMLQETLLQIHKRQIEIIPMLTIVNFVDIIL